MNAITRPELFHLDRRTKICTAVDMARADFRAETIETTEDGANVAATDGETLNTMALYTHEFIRKMQSQARRLEASCTANPQHSQTWFQTVIGQAVTDHYNLSASAARVFTSELEAL